MKGSTAMYGAVSHEDSNTSTLYEGTGTRNRTGIIGNWSGRCGQFLKNGLNSRKEFRNLRAGYSQRIMPSL
jgi:hypothetical protein